MTFQNSKNPNAKNFEIVIEDLKLYFSKYPDFPIFEKSIFPTEMWQKMDINFSELIEDISRQTEFHQKLFDLLDDEFRSFYTPTDRRAFLDSRSENAEKIINRFYEIVDPSFVPPEGTEKEIETEAYHLHCMIKYDICNENPIDDFRYIRNSMIFSSIYKQGYEVDPCTGEIINHVTGETIQESQI
ncbi:hypothetical protein PM03_09215 [Thalassobacter stenotrophicus]|uniref:hypothetical protein n=1 Tax=Thalassobacter stenotrophicus TaxID=266809 RepID=UPI00051F93AB|nr:hypothetical protein [Thalassobacter stenotrophicus]KGK79653.1 hypothetical protein PM03_09215 [Thalassobacter stenotrophicus]